MCLVRVDNISKKYVLGEVEVTALKEVSFSVEKGEFLSIMGASGSGKSTLMNILGCLDVPSQGHYYLNGEDVATLDENQLADIRKYTIGFVFQGFNLLARMSALENVELPMLYNGIPTKERHERAHHALSIVGLEDRADHQPQQLSGGQQQRVAIARALANDAPLILADEPTGNLDSKTGIDVMNLFVRLNRESGKTIIQVTHERDMAQFGSRIITLKDGILIKDERVESLC
ncbi:MAG: ABC transporter ATP-binding protein [Aminobacterium sp.]|uniref:Putative ABC transporter ATP-binding protein YknY n=1 Tax=bioreactor metagenome TaxID=1076179 RepID=A0A644YQX2_9ZZZZ|nr:MULTISPECIES: ABC transporter ATP-binding protein [unclassified Aminobacterium]MDD2207325.1 ABC transporter ATP-binding protein [Aminobacterium sp.]MDD3707382.1 ABC transporter ATP-binding protein [Aminobacterium sp.]MDD4229384.1 ABC transporter ATP-binding protein [Aminobacterium sp.]MDD4552258.1 ABC transporter ATP-binding protein [Aminobacterium sp.]MEA4877677.1 ABC transporter ATP-binding protein [Aminobacterium sp.]